MEIVHTDSIFQVTPGTTPNYDQKNSLLSLVNLVERVRLAAEREYYKFDSLQYLFPFDYLGIYGPSGADFNILDPTQQDNKTDFQKQNVRSFRATDSYLIRGWVSAGDWTGPFLRLSYRGGVDSVLSEKANHQLGDKLKVWVKVGNDQGVILDAPYNRASDRYEVELWGYGGDNLRNLLDQKGRDAFDRGELQARIDLVKGGPNDFRREDLAGQYLIDVNPNHTMHPILPLVVQLAWATQDQKIWDSKEGANYQYSFNMVLRGWENYLGVGVSSNPHGGVNFLEYRNLMSNYGRYAGSHELGRHLEPWNFNAFGTKNHLADTENFLAVDYMDLHILKPSCGIGLHRHRDNQEVFLMMEGQGLMVVGDWCKMPDRERCFEIRTLKAGHFALLKGGNLHGLLNPSDENLSLFMFGGYD